MSCNIINVGKEVLSFDDIKVVKDCVWLVYEYADDYDNYCGSGKAIALHRDGRLLEFDLGHCSCYGPTEHMDYGDGKELDCQRFIDSIEDVNQGEAHKVDAKAVELLLGGVNDSNIPPYA
jgi:hypothetical protein